LKNYEVVKNAKLPKFKLVATKVIYQITLKSKRSMFVISYD